MGTKVQGGGQPLFSSFEIQTNSSGAIVEWAISGLDADDNTLVTSNVQPFFVEFVVIGNGVADSLTPGTWTITTVPEPGTFVTLGSGILALAGAFRRRKRTSS
jgi:hypothetical protein